MIKIQELGHVVLYVQNLNKSADFYKDVLGFLEISRKQGMAAFSGGRTHHELLLIEVGGRVPERKVQPGLYHIGFKIGDGPLVIKKTLAELRRLDVEIIGTADHTVTHSIYILDPDGNELELYSDVSDEWKKNPDAVMTPTKQLPH